MNAIQYEVSDGTMHIINVGLQYFGQSDISVYLNLGDTPLIEGTDYQWTSSTAITFLAGGVFPGGIVPNGDTIVLRRRTEADTMFNILDGGAPFNRYTLDENYRQLLFLAQEFTEGVGLNEIRQNLNMRDYRVVNLGDPIAVKDAANKGYVDDLIAELVESGEGPIAAAANVAYIDPADNLRNVQDMSSGGGADMIGFDPTLPTIPGSVGEALRNIKFPSQFNSLAEWAASGGNLGIVAGTYPITEQLTFPHGTTINTYGKVIFDASAVTSLANFPEFTVVMAGGINLTPLPKLTTASIGSLTQNFQAAHGLKAGDVWSIFDPADSSYGPGHRTAYHAGEFCRVARVVSPTQLVLDSPLYATYVAANMDYYKLNGGSFDIIGNLVVRGSDTLNTMRAFRGFGLIDADLSGLTAISPMGPAAVELRQCVGKGGNFIGEQWALSGLGVDYGLSIAGCQDLDISGYFVGSRHGFTTGGYGQAGDCVNRNIQLRGTVKTTFQGSVAAVNLHGNTEFFSFTGLSYGGVELAGNFSRVNATIFQSSLGYCVWFGELSGHDHDISGSTLRALSNPGPARGVVDLGGDTIPALAGTLGGTINLSGITIIAPNATRGIMCRQRVCTATDINIDVRDVNIQKLAAGAVALYVDKVSGADYNVLMRSGFVDNTGSIQSVAGVTTVKGARASGKVSFNTGTGVSSLSLAVTYPAGLFGSTAPAVACSVSSAIVGTKGIVCSAASQSPTGFTATIATADGTNFSSVVAITFGWSAESID